MAALRFAPSPNGQLHLGHAYSALLNYELAQKTGARFLIRLEDIDTTRCTQALAKQCLDDLRWLGLTWEEPVRVQSHHFADYRTALNRLESLGLLYPCFCTRRDIGQHSHAHDPDGAPLYPGTCRHVSDSESRARIDSGTPYALRLRMDEALKIAATPLTYPRLTSFRRPADTTKAQPARWGDAIMARKETPTSYHVSVVFDDALQHITHVVRGADLEAATDLHALLQSLLGLPTPTYHHHALITHNGDKLSKSKNSPSLASLRAQGTTPDEVRNMLYIERAVAELLK